VTLSPHQNLHPAPPWTRKDLALVAILIIAGGAIRIIGLNEGLWFDEISTLLKYARLPVGEIIENYQTRNNHILYSLLAHYSVAWFGESAWSLRLPAALLGVATIPATYYLGRQLASRNEAFLVSAFLAVSYHHVWFSQNARGYTGLLLGTVLLSSCFIRLLTIENPGYRPVFAYAVIAALTSWIHLTAALVVIAHGIIWLAVISPLPGREKTGLKVAAALGLFLAALFSLALYTPLLTRIPAEFSVIVVNPENRYAWHTIEWVLGEFWNAALNAVPGGWPIILLGILAMAGGIWAYWKQGIVSAAMLILPVLVTVIFASRHSQVFFPRFLFGSMVFFLLIAVRGGFVLSRAVLPMLNARQITIIGLAVALATFTRVPAAWKPKQDFIAAAKFINAHREPGDAVVCPTYTFLPLHDYLELDCQRAGTRIELNRVEEGHSRTWFLYTFPVPFQSRYPDVWGKVQKDYTPVTKFRSTVGGGNIVIMLNSRRSPGKGTKKEGNGAP
jgi:mannosyltransferase